jgi:hypothetical protein
MLAPANAVDSSYTCQGTTGPLGAIPVSAVSPFDASYVSGATVPAEAFTMDATIPVDILQVVVALVPGATTLGATLQGYPTGPATMSWVPAGGGTAVPVTFDTLSAPSTPFTVAAPLELPVAGSTDAFTAPAPGVYDVKLPASFGFVPLANSAPIPGIPALPCALTTGAESVIGQVTVTEAAAKESSTTKAKLLNSPVNVGERAKYRVKVVDESGDPATGTVVAKKGTKVLAKGTLTDGKKVLRLPKLRKGSHTIVFKYKGNSTTEASKVTKTLRVYR